MYINNFIKFLNDILVINQNLSLLFILQLRKVKYFTEFLNLSNYQFNF